VGVSFTVFFNSLRIFCPFLGVVDCFLDIIHLLSVRDIYDGYNVELRVPPVV
jgi:hypothetical protein